MMNDNRWESKNIVWEIINEDEYTESLKIAQEYAEWLKEKTKKQ